MSVLKGLTFTTVVRNAAISPEQYRRGKLIGHLREQLEMAKADINSSPFNVKKRRWDLTEDGRKLLVEVDKRLKRWWTKNADGTVVLTVRWGSKLIEFEKGKAGITASDMQALVGLIERLIEATAAGELDGMIANINKQRKVAKKRAS